MKNQKSIVIARIVFVLSVLSVLCSYNANASVYKAMDSLVSLVNEIGLKQEQLNQVGVSIFSDSEMDNHVMHLRIHHATLLARQQPGVVPSRVVYMQQVRKETRRSKSEHFAELAVQKLTGLMSMGKGDASFTAFNGIRYHLPQLDLLDEGDKLENEQVAEAAKEFLSAVYKILVKDVVFLVTCTNLGLAGEYETTMNLIRAALQ
ncbi:hypothetical protein [Endozoicomonas sp. 4G]|uniref:hypothetical protein n=1 Tax=Endozoicomonas sp. 4G TaxID=2872754 RepID=UPI002078D5C7|nr:hypothetical protein [Endozoicomonas sp. 4G]